MERNGKPVHLLLNTRQKVEHRRGGPYPHQQRRITAIEFRRAVAVILGQPGNRNVEAQGPPAPRGVTPICPLPPSAMTRSGELRALGLQPTVSAIDHLTHRGIVVRASTVLMLKCRYSLRAGFPSRKTTHEGNRMRPLQVRIVEAFDVPRRTVEPQLFCRAFHQPFGMTFRIPDFEVLQLLGPVDPGTLARKLQQIEFLAPLGHREGHAVEQQRRRRRNGTITSRASSPPATFSTMYWIASVSMSRSSSSMPVEVSRSARPPPTVADPARSCTTPHRRPAAAKRHPRRRSAHSRSPDFPA